MRSFCQVMTVAIPFTVVLDDPLSNSYIQNLYAPDDDPNMVTEIYERSHEQNDELGLNDMRTENYGEQEQEQQDATEERPGQADDADAKRRKVDE